MRTRIPRFLTILLAVFLILLIALGALVAWRVSADRPARDARHRVEEQLTELRHDVQTSGVNKDQAEAMTHDLTTQLGSVGDSGTADSSNSSGSVTDAQGLSRAYDDSARAVLDTAADKNLPADQATTYTSIAVSHWLTARKLDGTLSDLSDPGSAAARSLTELTGVGPTESLDTSGTCPAGSTDDLLRNLYEAQWSEGFFAARAGADGTDAGTAQRVEAAQDLHEDSLAQYREARGSDCGTLPEPKASYRVAERDPGRSVSAQATDLAGESLSLVRAQHDDGQASAAWTAWATRSLAENAALFAWGNHDVPALPGADR